MDKDLIIDAIREHGIEVQPVVAHRIATTKTLHEYPGFEKAIIENEEDEYAMDMKTNADKHLFLPVSNYELGYSLVPVYNYLMLEQGAVFKTIEKLMEKVFAGQRKDPYCVDADVVKSKFKQVLWTENLMLIKKDIASYTVKALRFSTAKVGSFNYTPKEKIDLRGLDEVILMCYTEGDSVWHITPPKFREFYMDSIFGIPLYTMYTEDSGVYAAVSRQALWNV